jgi:hypothetical protein
MKEMEPAIKKGKVKILGEQAVKDWLPANALSIAENVLTQFTRTRSTASSARTTVPPAASSRLWLARSWQAKSRSPARTPNLLLQAHHRWHADDDGLQVAQPDRHRSGQAVRRAGQGRRRSRTRPRRPKAASTRSCLTRSSSPRTTSTSWSRMASTPRNNSVFNSGLASL